MNGLSPVYKGIKVSSGSVGEKIVVHCILSADLFCELMVSV